MIVGMEEEWAANLTDMAWPTSIGSRTEIGMAYSFSDPYRPLRISMRLNGVVVGFGLGLLLLWAPNSTALFLSGGEAAILWPARLAGAALISLGLFFVLASGERIIHPPTLVTIIVANALFAGVLLVSYLQGEWVGLSLAGLLLVVVVALCLVGAVLPVRYLRAEYRAP